jgi:beta-1,2-mannobiose phosphorylase / 1,2-beta-oligomannan phosphorylase
MSGFQMQRLGVVMEPEPGNPLEEEGVLNPAAVRGPDGELYLFPRLVARGNYSLLGIARVKFNGDGNPTGVEQLGIALEPEAVYELRSDGGAGCEDPRISYAEDIKRYVMSHLAFSPKGPRVALALSVDQFHWERLELATFCPSEGIKFDGIVKDSASERRPVSIEGLSTSPITTRGG